MKYTLIKLILAFLCANMCSSLLAMERPIEKEQDKQEETALSALNAIVEHLQTELNAAQMRYELLEQLLLQKNSDLEEYKQEMARLKTHITELESRLQQANRTIIRLNQQLHQAKQDDHTTNTITMRMQWILQNLTVPSVSKWEPWYMGMGFIMALIGTTLALTHAPERVSREYTVMTFQQAVKMWEKEFGKMAVDTILEGSGFKR